MTELGLTDLELLKHVHDIILGIPDIFKQELTHQV